MSQNATGMSSKPHPVMVDPCADMVKRLMDEKYTRRHPLHHQRLPAHETGRGIE